MQKQDEQFKEDFQNTMKIMKAGLETIENGKETFRCPVCGGIGKCWKSKINGHKGINCPGCEVTIRE